jgi:hypothetical protein
VKSLLLNPSKQYWLANKAGYLWVPGFLLSGINDGCGEFYSPVYR